MFPPESTETKRHLEKFKRDFLTISCGDYSYGCPIIELARNDLPRKLTIGRYCSIGANVKIFVGRQGIHPTDTLSTYPLGLAVSPQTRALAPKATQNYKATDSIAENLDVTVGNDVWIGTNVVILAGVSIGHGAVIGAGAIVTQDVPNFAIVVGSPARVLKYRHDEETINRILNSQWWELEPDEIWLRVGENFSSTSISEVLTMLSAEKELSEDELIFKFWPSEEIQRQYTGAHGDLLLQRTKRFVSFLEKEGAFTSPNSSILDYGCGWGRIASVIYVLHNPQITSVDAWEKSLEFLQQSQLPVNSFKIPEKLDEQSLGCENYDVIYSFSIFTHLNIDAFINNISFILAALKENGRFYFTVRHEDFLEMFNSKKPNSLPVTEVGCDDFLHFSYVGENYGETIIGKDFIRNRFENITYHGVIDPFQHLYCITKK
ncbi:MAG: DapH/DapD/GlmU-related protein [Methylovulum sp.]|nr:DapH/DapD/GlmU-related protein [Methylovulum sp.]